MECGRDRIRFEAEPEQFDRRQPGAEARGIVFRNPRQQAAAGAAYPDFIRQRSRELWRSCRAE